MKTILLLIGVGILWGVTNPIMRLGSRGIEKLADTYTRIYLFLAFLLNQCGSLLFVWTLQNAALSTAVPIANSLSFAFTAITGYCLGEQLPGKKIVLGTVLVSLGSILMSIENNQIP